MKIQYLSDIHTEFLTTSKFRKLLEKIQPSAEVLVLAGDIGNPFSEFYYKLVSHVSKLFKLTLVVSGNHEYYQKQHTMEEVEEKITEVISKFPSVVYLNNSCYNYEGYKFVGTTLWSNITNKTSKQTNDLTQIKDLSVELYNCLHEDCVDFLKEELQTKEPVVVITHYLPSFKLIDSKYNSELNQWFASELDELIKEPVKVWIYGHTHTQSESIVSGVKLVCNPVGYPNENSNIDFTKVVEF